MSKHRPREALDPLLELKATRFYGGTPTAFGAPLVQDARSLHEFDVAYLGIPYQAPAAPGRETSLIYNGTILAPNKFRHNSVKYGGYLPEFDMHLFERLRFCDYGNADIVGDLKTSLENVRTRVADILAAGCIPLTMGGNGPGAGNPVIEAICDWADGPVAVLNFDAHHDNYAFSAAQLADDRGTPWGEGWANLIFDNRNLAPRHFQHIGLRGPRADRDAIQRFVDKGVPSENVYTYKDIRRARRDGLDSWVRTIVDRIGDDTKLWIAFDPDVIDTAGAPHGEPLGLQIEEIIEILHAAGRSVGRERLGGITFMAMPPDEIHVHWAVVYMALYTLAGALGASWD